MDKHKPGATPYHMFQRVLIVMAELDHDKRPWAAGAIVAAWVAFSFLQDACAGFYIRVSENVLDEHHAVLLPLILSLAQVITCLSVLKFDCAYGPFLESITIIVCSHLSGSFVKNLWIQTKEHEAGVLGSFVDPLLVQALLFILRGSYVNHIRSLSMVLVSLGAILASISFHTIVNTDRSVTITLLCGLFMILRNICVVYWHDEHVVIGYRSKKTLGVVFSSVLFLMIGMTSLLYPELMVTVPIMLVSCVLHAAVTYITCSQLLAKFSIPTVCILSSCVKAIESQFYIHNSYRPALVTCVAACVIFIIGLYLYTHDVVETGHVFHSHKNVSTHEMFTRTQFILFFASAIGVLVYVLQPRVSERDLNTLSYVGLDTIVRRLLNIDMPEDHEH